MGLDALKTSSNFVRRGLSRLGSEYHYTFEQGYPTPETVRQAYDDADLNRAIQAYRFFYPTVSGMAIVVFSVSTQCEPCTDRPTPPPMVMPSSKAT